MTQVFKPYVCIGELKQDLFPHYGTVEEAQTALDNYEGHYEYALIETHYIKS